MSKITDTIAAIATASGEGSIGIVRVSGSESLSILQAIFTSASKTDIAKLDSHRIYYGHIFDEDNQGKNIVDEVLVSYMQAPKSFTSEDVVEINCHGGLVPLNKILELTIKNGARLAEPGEFTKRAFLNGRIDLTQAESIIDIIRAKTGTSLKVAVNQLQGGLSEEINTVRGKLLGMLAVVEANIDFPEEDIAPVDYNDFREQIKNIVSRLEKLVLIAEEGKVYREGLKTAIVGKPNVGKSSLLNVLLKENRAIVTDIPGTTRDVIEEVVNLGGIPLNIMDTAGIRDTTDVVEKIGVEKSYNIMEEADLILFVVDLAREITSEDIDIFKRARENSCIVILNKVDLNSRNDDFKEDISHQLPGIQDMPLVEISAKEKIGIEELINQIKSIVHRGEVVTTNDIIVSNTRHMALIKKSIEHLKEVKSGIEMEIPVDFLSIDFTAAYEILGEVIGETVHEDLIDQIFADFCLGK